MATIRTGRARRTAASTRPSVTARSRRRRSASTRSTCASTTGRGAHNWHVTSGSASALNISRAERIRRAVQLLDQYGLMKCKKQAADTLSGGEGNDPKARLVADRQARLARARAEQQTGRD